jgi:hypothetical protein
VAAFLLPPLLLRRIVGNIRRAGRPAGERWRALPLLLFWVLTWTAGEVVGYWFGAGDALERVR